MSMIGNLLRVSNTELEAYLKDSSLLEKRIYDDESETYGKHAVDIDKAWDGIVFLLTGASLAHAEHPLVKVLFSGQLIDEDQDLGYGPGHYLLPEEVTELNNRISSLTTADLKKNYHPQKMTEQEVYPDIWDEGDEAFEYLSQNFTTIQKVYAEAAKNGEAIITYIN